VANATGLCPEQRPDPLDIPWPLDQRIGLPFAALDLEEIAATATTAPIARSWSGWRADAL
jgi:hypothetical protein